MARLTCRLAAAGSTIPRRKRNTRRPSTRRRQCSKPWPWRRGLAGELSPRPEKDRLFVRPFDFHTVSFDGGIVLERLVNDAAVEGAERLQLNDVSPTPDFFGGVLGFLNQGFAGLGAVAADVHHHFWHRRVLLKEQPVGNVLQVGERLALAPDEAARIVGFDIEQNAFLPVMLFHSGGEAEQLEHLF